MGEISSLLLATQGVSAAAGVAGGVAQAGAYRAQGSAENRLANVNAGYSDWQARDAIERGNLDASRAASGKEAMASTLRASMGASGVDVNSGSAAAATSDLYLMGQLDALTVQNNATREAMGYRVQGINERTRGRMAMIGAKNAAGQSIAQAGMNAGRDLIHGAYLADKYSGLEDGVPKENSHDRYTKAKYSRSISGGK